MLWSATTLTTRTTALPWARLAEAEVLRSKQL
jgi:hypothetical protein